MYHHHCHSRPVHPSSTHHCKCVKSLHSFKLFCCNFQLNVTASPDLPGGLTYNCLFSGDGPEIVVPAIEVVAGSQYQCDLTDSTIAVDGVKEGLRMLNKTPVINSLSPVQSRTSVLSVLKLVFHSSPVRMLSPYTTALLPRGMNSQQ